MPRVSKKETKIEKVKPAVKKTEGLSVPAFAISGAESGTLELPKELFAGKVNKPLLAQALRVYLSNLKGHFSNTKTRAEVDRTTKKLYRQKGTGGARHGSKKAPIFVGGGIALGPKFRKNVLDLPKKMKRAALISALSSKMAEKEVFGMADLDKVSGKTVQMQNLLVKLGKKNVLILTGAKEEKAINATKNLKNIRVLAADQANILVISRYNALMLTKEAVDKLESRIESQKETK